MKSTKILTVLTVLAVLISACGGPKSSELDKKKEELAKKEKALADLKAEIKTLQTAIEQLDTEMRDNSIAVYAEELRKGEFKNPFQLQGLVESDQNVMITPEVPARITSIAVREGQHVEAGQVIAQLDASIAQSQVAELSSALTLAETNYLKQKSLWDQKIGSEMQYLQAKNQFDNLTKSLETAKKQLAKYTLRSPISGTVDEIMANAGELVGSMTGGPVARVVNLSSVKIKANVSEKYVDQIRKGQEVEVYLPSIDLTLREKVEAVGNVIDVNNRTFSVYVRPTSAKTRLKPNMLALITAYDFVESEVITIPTKLVRNDNGTDYVLTLEKRGDKRIVRKTPIEIEKEFASLTIVKSGLNAGDLIITEGYNSVVENDEVKIMNKK
ncbi:MAG: efflux RND transporter periplasmic adaptor subunit [Flavobacteriales bacterium]|nr:efflux RND transporter periplasmic adaptor subunit [Bacteroidota bacterium]MCB9241180.1 efflux RND transporter periplasmic adaptor subunit [Flavobacteriales bacterium]